MVATPSAPASSPPTIRASSTSNTRIHAIEPNPNAAGREIRGAHNLWNGRLSDRLPWRSVWFERSAQGENLLLRVSGYTEFPCMAPRWDVVGTDSWGSGPGWVALGDARQLQVQQQRKLEAIDKQIRPPMVGPPSLKNEPASLLPGGVTYVADPNGQSFRPAIDVRLDFGALAADIPRSRAASRRRSTPTCS